MRGDEFRQGMRGGTRKKGGEGGLLGLLCSRNARPKKGLVRRAQWETKQATPLRRNELALKELLL